jgi:hypothetical protein
MGVISSGCLKDAGIEGGTEISDASLGSFGIESAQKPDFGRLMVDKDFQMQAPIRRQPLNKFGTPFLLLWNGETDLHSGGAYFKGLRIIINVLRGFPP